MSYTKKQAPLLQLVIFQLYLRIKVKICVQSRAIPRVLIGKGGGGGIHIFSCSRPISFDRKLLNDLGKLLSRKISWAKLNILN